MLDKVGETVEALKKELSSLRRESTKISEDQTKRLDELSTTVASTQRQTPKKKRARSSGSAARVGVFVDVQNMYYAARRLKGKLDFDALLKAAVRDRRLVQPTAYVVESKEIDQSGFIAMLEQRAIEVRRKTLSVRADGSMKGDWDMELALDILDAAPRLDVVVLVSGDGDFTSLVKRVKQMGPRVEVIGFPRNTAKSLLEAADHFTPLDRKFMIYPRRPKTATPPPRLRKKTVTKPGDSTARSSAAEARKTG
ncbi:MAG: NYN domain-containing protein [bacterium]|nr:NYN domain-containing protein [bacterium]